MKKKILCEIQTQSINANFNEDIDTGTEIIDKLNLNECDACFWYYTVKKGSNIRAGSILACWDSVSSIVKTTENYTESIGDTTHLEMNVLIENSEVQLKGIAQSDDWQVKVTRFII